MESFRGKLNEAVALAKKNLTDKPWTKALSDLDALAQDFNSCIEHETNKRLGTTLQPVSAVSMPANIHPSVLDLMSKCKVYRLCLVSEGRTKVEMDLAIFAVPNNGMYPVLMLHEVAYQPIGSLDSRELLEQQFLVFMRHAQSNFMRAVLGSKEA